MEKEYVIKIRHGMELGYGEEIIRCKDCNRRNTILCPVRNTITNADKDFADNWFCADGERRTET